MDDPNNKAALTKEMEEAIEKSTSIQHFSKGTILLEEGKKTNECYYIIKGCIRCFYIKDGIDRTTEIYTEGEAVTPSVYGKNLPSEYNIECVEDTTAKVGDALKEIELYKQYPEAESLTLAYMESNMAQKQDALSQFKLSSPEERYLNLLKNKPELLQRVPQHQIASYLGIKPESLSRIRKRIKK